MMDWWSILHDTSNDNNDRRYLEETSSDDIVSSVTHQISDLSSTPNGFEEDKGRDWGAILSNVFLFCLVYGLSATVKVRSLTKQLGNKVAIYSGIIMQFIVMPFLGYMSVKIFQVGLSEAVGITLLVVTASPGGSFSNWYCSIFNADLPLSVAMTTVSSILSMLALPVNLLFYTWLVYGNVEEDEGESILKALNFSSLFISLGLVLVAIVSGVYSGEYLSGPYPIFNGIVNRLAAFSGLFLILYSIFLSEAEEEQDEQAAEEDDGGGGGLFGQNWYFYLAVATPCIAGIALANIISKWAGLIYPEMVTLAIECCYQNTGIGTAVAISMFTNPIERAQAVCVPLLYGIVEAFAIGIYCIIAWKIGWTKAPIEDNFCTIVTTSYDVNDDDDDEENNNKDDDDPRVATEDTALLT